jgi:hypothetical protein
MEFYEDDQDVVCFWTPNENHQGWLISRKFQTSAMTTSLNIKYRKPVPVDKQLEIRAKLRETFPKEKAEKEFHFLPYEVEE